MDKDQLQRYREFLKDGVRRQVDFSATAQGRGVPAPPIEKPCPAEAGHIALPPPDAWKHVVPVDLVDAIRQRRSCRRYSSRPLLMDELSFLLWATQGIREILGAGTALRTVPSAGARHALETYLCAMNVDTLEPGVYRYLPVENELVRVATVSDLPARLTAATLEQGFVGRAAVTFVWTAVPYRMEWRYGPAAHKVIAIDAGHVCQNLYLACQAVHAGACAVAAYDQEAVDHLVGVDGEDEFAVYLAPVGKLRGSEPASGKPCAI